MIFANETELWNYGLFASYQQLDAKQKKKKNYGLNVDDNIRSRGGWQGGKRLINNESQVTSQEEKPKVRLGGKNHPF